MIYGKHDEPALLEDVSTKTRHGIAGILTLRIRWARKRFYFRGTFEEFLLAEMKKNVHTAGSEVHAIHSEACWVREHVNTLRAIRHKLLVSIGRYAGEDILDGLRVRDRAQAVEQLRGR